MQSRYMSHTSLICIMLLYMVYYFVDTIPMVSNIPKQSGIHVHGFAYLAMNPVFWFTMLFSQIPCGLLVDRVGQQRMLNVSIGLLLVGLLCDQYTLLASWMLGIAVAIAGPLLLKQVALENAKFATTVAICIGFAIASVSILQHPLMMLMDFFGHTQVYLLCAMCVSLLWLIQLGSGSEVKESPSYDVVFQKELWLHSSCAALQSMPLLVLIGTLVPEYMRVLYDLPEPAITAYLHLYLCFASIGAVCIGWFVDRYGFQYEMLFAVSVGQILLMGLLMLISNFTGFVAIITAMSLISINVVPLLLQKQKTPASVLGLVFAVMLLFIKGLAAVVQVIVASWMVTMSHQILLLTAMLVSSLFCINLIWERNNA
jgi:MFS family permease